MPLLQSFAMRTSTSSAGGSLGNGGVHAKEHGNLESPLAKAKAKFKQKGKGKGDGEQGDS